MAYTPKNWQTGEIIEAEELNHMEQGIAAADAAATGTGTIGTQQLANGSVTTPKIAPASVTNDKLDQEAVDSNNIRTGAIITPLIYDGAVTLPKLGADVIAELDNKANIDGYYQNLGSGTSDQLNSSVGIEDSTPYNFRTSGGSTEIGDREELNAVVGVSVPWNQLVQNGNFADTAVWVDNTGTFAVADNVGSFTASEQTKGISNTIEIKAHKYLLSLSLKTTAAANGIRIQIRGGSMISLFSAAVSGWQTVASVISPSAYAGGYVRIADYRTSGFDKVEVKDVVLIDLTLALGSTIADYIYALEQSNAGSGVAYFKKLFPKPYYAYNSGALLSVRTNLHRMVGFNQFDSALEFGNINSSGNNDGTNQYYVRSKDYVKVVPSTIYCFYASTSQQFMQMYCIEYDANKNFIARTSVISGSTLYTTRYATFTLKANTHYIRLFIYKNTSFSSVDGINICLSLHWDGERDGEYEPYEAHEYALDDITLRGVLKLDSSNNLYADGDRYLPDGTVERRYGVVDLSTLTWTDSGAYYTGQSVLPNVKTPANGSVAANAICSSYVVTASNNVSGGTVNGIGIRPNGYLYATDNGAPPTGYLVYELATPTTETASPYQQTQIVDDFGTEEFVDAAVEAGERDVAIPVGNETVYKANLRAKLEMAPDSPDGDGDYIVRQSNGQNSYIPLVEVKELPDMPSSDGNYTLRCTVTNGTATLSWVSA